MNWFLSILVIWYVVTGVLMYISLVKSVRAAGIKGGYTLAAFSGAAWPVVILVGLVKGLES